MDIRSFFQKKPPSNGSSGKKVATPAKSTKQAEPEPTPTKRPATRRAAKQNVVVLDDSDEDEEVAISKRKAPAKKKSQHVDSDSDFEMMDDDEKPKKQPMKRLRRAAKDSDDDEEMPEVKPKVKETTEPSAVSSSPMADDLDEAPVKQEGALKKVPAPCSGCLDGKTFAFSGVLESLSREDAVHLVKSCGGSVANNITRSTKYLVIGATLEQGGKVTDGSKYKEAVAKNVRILTQNEFYNLITEAAAAQQAQDLVAEKAKIKAEAAEAAGAKTASSKGKQKLNTSINAELWTDKYKPQTLDHMIGNVELGKKLMVWLKDWEAMHVKGTKKIPFTTKLSENRGAKTVLLSGPPGIGKTTIANLVARQCGFECTELNASDTRSKKMLQTGLKDVLGTQALQFGVPSGKSKEKMHLARRVIIMDEVDGMSGGDRGGTAELIQLIKKSKTPIICICNDRQSQKVRSLANHSFDLRMRRPTKVQIGKRLMEIGLKEGLNMEKNAIEEAADRCGNDIRQLLTQMQRWRLTTTKITYADMVNPSSQHNKDESLRLNPFSATQQIFQRDISFDARNEAYFVDYDLMPLMVQENYIQSIMNNKTSSDENLEKAMYASEFISESDLLNTYVRVEQRWDLLTKQAAMNVGACVYSAGFIGHPEFSKWLGKNSSASKSKRLLSELSVRMRSHASGSREVIRLDYVPYMKEILLKKLLSGDDNISEVIELLDECEITREDLTESMESFKFPGIKRHSYSELDTKAKTAFTRMYNKASHKSQAVVESVLGSTTIKKGRGKAAVKDEDNGLPPASDAESEPDDEEDLDVSKFQKKARGGAKRKAPAAAKKTRKAPAKKRRLYVDSNRSSDNFSTSAQAYYHGSHVPNLPGQCRRLSTGCKVCGKSCSAIICRHCLGRHVEVTLQKFYPGLLPRICCPICLVAMHASCWEGRVPADIGTTLRTTYGNLCRQACALLPPCCHEEDYTHLPVFDPVRKPSDPIALLPSRVENFKKMCKKFCRHKLEPRAVLDFAFDSFGEAKALVVMNELAIPRIQDPERRATLLLSLLYFRPNTKTHCCGFRFCFNCKCMGHHDVCTEEFDEDNDLVRCRSCRVLLLKVQGCDFVMCVCGLSMSWNQEQLLRRERRKGLVPVDILDLTLTDFWLVFRYKQNNVNTLIWLQKHVIAVRRLLRPLFARCVWRFRFSKILTALRPAWEAKRARYVDQAAVSLRGSLRPALSSFIWRRRFTRMVPYMESELFWKAYYRWHPDDLDTEEMNTIFSIGMERKYTRKPRIYRKLSSICVMLEEECVSAINGVEGNVDAWFRWQQGWILETDWSKSYWWTFKLGETYQIETGQYDTEWYSSSMHGSGERVRANQEPDKTTCLMQFVNQLYGKKIGEISSRWDDHGRLEFQQRTPIEYAHAKIKLGDVFDYYTTAPGVLQIPEWACFKYAVEHYLENDPRTKYHPSRVREFIEENGLDRLEEME